MLFFFFKQTTAYEMRIVDWSSDVCSSDLRFADRRGVGLGGEAVPAQRGGLDAGGLRRRTERRCAHAGGDGGDVAQVRTGRAAATDRGATGRASGRDRRCQEV